MSHLSTQATLCSIRYTVDTRDPFYEAENEYNDQQSPLLQEKLQEFQKALTASPFRKELEEELGELLFRNIELELKSFSPEIIPLMQEENQLQNEYQKLYASAQIPFQGKTVTWPSWGPIRRAPTGPPAGPPWRLRVPSSTRTGSSSMSSTTSW